MISINEFDFDHTKYNPTVSLEDQQMDNLTNKQIMLNGLRSFCLSCRMCSLGCSMMEEKGKTFDPHVFSNMNDQAHYFVIGQNPGFDECMQGTPFIGAAGKNFDEELDKNGLHRRMFYISNAVRCHTLKNEKPSTQHLEKCEHILKLELEIIRPKLIITLGAFAFDYMCPEIKYNDGLGSINESRFGYKVYSVYHPSPLNINDKERRKIFNRQIYMLSKIIEKLGT